MCKEDESNVIGLNIKDQTLNYPNVKEKDWKVEGTGAGVLAGTVEDVLEGETDTDAPEAHDVEVLPADTTVDLPVLKKDERVTAASEDPQANVKIIDVFQKAPAPQSMTVTNLANVPVQIHVTRIANQNLDESRK